MSYSFVKIVWNPCLNIFHSFYGEFFNAQLGAVKFKVFSSESLGWMKKGGKSSRLPSSLRTYSSPLSLMECNGTYGGIPWCLLSGACSKSATLLVTYRERTHAFNHCWFILRLISFALSWVKGEKHPVLHFCVVVHNSGTGE